MEADVPGNALTQRRLDLKAKFYQRIQEHVRVCEDQTRLHATITALERTIANKNTELVQLRMFRL